MLSCFASFFSPLAALVFLPPLQAWLSETVWVTMWNRGRVQRMDWCNPTFQVNPSLWARLHLVSRCQIVKSNHSFVCYVKKWFNIQVHYSTRKFCRIKMYSYVHPLISTRWRLVQYKKNLCAALSDFCHFTLAHPKTVQKKKPTKKSSDFQPCYNHRTSGYCYIHCFLIWTARAVDKHQIKPFTPLRTYMYHSAYTQAVLQNVWWSSSRQNKNARLTFPRYCLSML